MKKKIKSNVKEIWDFWGPVLLTISLYIGIRHYIAEARYIPSGSMLPGLQVHDRLLIEKLDSVVSEPQLVEGPSKL